MTYYAVWTSAYEDAYVVVVCSTRERAEQWMADSHQVAYEVYCQRTETAKANHVIGSLGRLATFDEYVKSWGRGYRIEEVEFVG